MPRKVKEKSTQATRSRQAALAMNTVAESNESAAAEPNEEAAAQKAAAVTELRRLVALANARDPGAVEALQHLLDERPQLWQTAGDLTKIAEDAWIELVSGNKAFAREAVRRKLTAMKQELEGPHPTAMERLLVDTAAIGWLAHRHAEAQATGAVDSIDQAAFLLKRAESAQKRMLNAVKALTTLRALAPRGLVPLNHLKVFDPQSKQA